MGKIIVQKSENADTRSCDFKSVTQEQLLESTISHKQDVRNGIQFVIDYLEASAIAHDKSKIATIDWFYSCFRTGFKDDSWLAMHRSIEKHHLSSEYPLNLMDIIEHIVDCVVAGYARTGTVYDITVSDEILREAVKNTVEYIKENIEVVEKHENFIGVCHYNF